MELTVSLLLDLVILGLLLYCLIQGLRRGFILTLCSLLAVLLAFLGGWYLATPPPSPGRETGTGHSPCHARPGGIGGRRFPGADRLTIPIRTGQPIREWAVSSLSPIPPGSADPDNRGLEAGDSCRAGCRGSWALARSLLFLAGFFGVLILWLILCHTLNLVAKLPGLHLLNKLLGASGADQKACSC